MDAESNWEQILNEATQALFALDDRQKIIAAIEAYGKQLFGEAFSIVRTGSTARSAIALPLPRDPEIVQYSGPENLISQVELLTQIGIQALEVAHLKLQVRRHAALAAVELAINRPIELDKVMDQIVQATTDLLPATGGSSITLWNAMDETFQLSASTVPDQGRDLTAKRVRKKGGATRWIVDHKEPVIVTDTRKDPFGANRMLDEFSLHAYAGFPMLMEDHVLGVLYALDNIIREYTDDDLEFLDALSARAAMAVCKVRIYEELTNTNLQLEDKTTELEVANRELEEFAHIVSHDLKAPLRGMHNISSWIKEDYAPKLDKEGEEMLTQMEKSSSNMIDLIDDILAYSKVGHLDPDVEEFELGELIHRVLDMMPTDGHRIEQPESWPTICADETRIQQVYINLIGNALKFIPADNGCIKLGYTEAENHWLFSVADNGPGIADKFHEYIFQPFRGNVTKSKVQGSGIGLAVCKKIVEQHNGHIEVESSPGEGATFRFTIAKDLPGLSTP